ncbi:hypothetical protein DSC45_02070 [Streptomyces sp. YIM 130001]|uniref:hypothetical protein n=1 Tax=Streptomyces sp. YIM 130001 TaxID=2259644 RepID=UPI000EEE1DAE|nr:hypothetical protein [Streptomyces sp. YIM 130001]RII20889.1 hypothetical protein DSC45_02070 [Streptomyces sp. YIM 130001]
MRLRDSVRRVPLRSALFGVLCCATLAGCGIRPTEVPTDFGPAPSRVPCAASAPEVGTQASAGIPVQVFLICSSQLVAVDRTVQLKDDAGASDRVRVAQALVDELQEPPSPVEGQSGFTTDVRGPITVAGPKAGDPRATLRLSADPAGLTPYALAQLVCTLAQSEAGEGGRSAVLGGPGAVEPRRYECADETRSRPGESGPPAETVG